jgi:hypothetical protein
MAGTSREAVAHHHPILARRGIAQAVRTRLSCREPEARRDEDVDKDGILKVLGVGFPLKHLPKTQSGLRIAFK